MRYGVPVAMLAAAVLVAGCSDGPPPAVIGNPPTPIPTPTYDGTQPPAAAVLALVPAEVATVTVTDLDQIRVELGMEEVSRTSTPEEIATFWQRASVERPLMAYGMLRVDDQELLATYGFSEIDVAWESHFYDADNTELGWVLRFRDGTDMGQVTAAADDPTSPLGGATVDAADLLASSGTTDDPSTSWAAEQGTAALLGTAAANSTYLSKVCTPHEGGEGDEDLEELDAYSVQFEGSLVTARLGEDRTDLSARLHLGDGDPAFEKLYSGGAADPRTGRIGYVMSDPPQAVGLALSHQLPFAACAG